MTKDKSMRRTACAPACKPAGNRLGGHVRLSLKKYWFIYLLILPGILSTLIYSYGPMILQAVLAFTDYKFADGIFGSEFVGFGNFVRLFTQLPEGVG